DGDLKLNGRQDALAGKRVLLVDDNSTSRRILSTVLDRWGVRPVSVGSGTEAVARLESGESYDVALIDLEMPEISGLRLAERIRDEYNASRIPIILMSPVGQRISNKSVVDRLLKKPVKHGQLRDALLTVFNLPTEEKSDPSTARHLDTRMASEWPLKILLAEDNLINQKVALRLLERLGYEADVVANGMEALVAVRHVQYDVILMDVQMPEMDGLEATRQLCKQYSPEERPRIVAVTADAQASDREECLRAGMDDYLSKPVRLEQIAEALSNCSRKTAVRHSNGGFQPPAPPSTQRQANSTSAESTSQVRQEVTPMEDEDLTLFGEDDPEFLADLIESYVDLTPSLITEMRRHLAAGDRGALKSVAHKMKSSSGQIGLSRLSGLCGDLQSASAGVKTDINLHDQVQLIESEYKRVVPLLHKKQQSLGGS
ncbi:MAG: response regulator, partial [Rhodothermales bacterium]|nr:response regulator [Rhodothermales bacterium]